MKRLGALLLGAMAGLFSACAAPQNRYEASLHIIAFEDTWKITGIELIDEKRLL